MGDPPQKVSYRTLVELMRTVDAAYGHEPMTLRRWLGREPTWRDKLRIRWIKWKYRQRRDPRSQRPLDELKTDR